jgi:hypothetical protein
MADNKDLQKPKKDERLTYTEWVKTTKCKLPGGGTLQASPPPDMWNLGDIVVDLQRGLNMFASVYAIIVAILQVIMCIIEIICALTNPFALIKAIIKLFGVCIPELILVLPQLAVLAYIICLIKIIIAIVTYMITVLIPLIQNLIANILNIKNAIENEDDDAIAALAFKITAMIKEVLNLLGILAPLEPIIEMIQALLSLAMGFPCDDDDPCCETSVCPDVLKNYYLDGYDGVLKTYLSGGSSYETYFSSTSKYTDLATLSDYFPSDANLSSITKIADAPYVLTIPKSSGTQYIVTQIFSGGMLKVTQLEPTQFSDGYLSSVYNVSGIPTAVDATGRYVRFGSASATFTSSDVNGYVTILDPTNLTNAGTWKIISVYDANNVVLDGTTTSAWTASTSLNPSTKNLVWYKLNSAPTDVVNGDFKLDFNHAMLMKHNQIGAGCHPAIRATKAITKARFPIPPVPTLPNISNTLSTLNNCIAPLENITDADVIADPDGISAKISTASVCITNVLNGLNNDMTSLAKNIYPNLIDLEASLLTATPSVQTVSNNVKVSVTPIDKYGGIIGIGLPSGTLNVKIFSTTGTVSSVTEEIDSNGDLTGVYSANLTSDNKGLARVSAKVGGSFLNEFDGTSLKTRFVDARFVDIREHVGDDSTEPMGEGAND